MAEWPNPNRLHADAPVNILIVDDSPANLLTLRLILEELGQQVVEAGSGEEALRLTQVQDFAIVFLDITLPGMDGFQTAQALRAGERGRHTPIIFVTAGDLDTEQLSRGYELGAVDFLAKPLLPLAVQSKAKALVQLFQEKQFAHREAEQLKLLVHSTREYAIFMLNPSGNIASWNTGAERLKGYAPEEIIGQHFSKFYPAEMNERGWPEHELTVAKAEGRFEDEGWRVRKDGSTFWANVVITAVRDGQGNLLGFSKITRDLTERKKAEEGSLRLAEEAATRKALETQSKQIEEQRERLQVTLASIGDAVMTTDIEGRVTGMNPVAESLTGWTMSEAKGLPLEEVFRIVNESTRQTVENPAAKSLRDGVVVGLANHTVLIAKDGAEHPIDDSAAPIRTKKGEVIGCVLVFRDVTERRETERSLQESELRYRLVGQAANDAIWDWDLLTNHVFWNEGVSRVFGYAPAEIGESADWWTEHIHPEDRLRISDGIHHAIDGTAESWRDEYRFLRANGSYAHVSDRGYIVREEGKPVRMVGSMLDLTERKEAQKALQAAEERFDFVRRSSGVGFWYCDLPFDVLQWDEQVKTHFHLPPDAQVTINTFYEKIHPADREPTRTAIDESIKQKTRYDVFYRTVDSSSGAEKWIRAIGRTTYDSGGSPIRFDGVTIDVTEQKRTESQLREVAAALSEAGHRKDEFLATLAHELRNPLAPIGNALQLLRLSSDAPTLEHARNVMDRQLTHMVRLVDDLMDVSRITRGKVDLRKEPVPLSTVIHSAVETSRPLLESMGHSLRTVAPPTSLMVDADLTRLAQVFSNLLNNAAKYSDPGSKITLTASQEAKEVVIRVKDAGIGIASDQLPHIFDMFMQVGRSFDRSQGGLGIGLTLVKRLVEMHHGTVEAKSEGVGKGSEFIIRLPLLSSGAKTTFKSQNEKLELNTSLRILIVDDNKDAANSLAMMLKLMGNITQTAHDGEEGVRLAKETRPDLILFDIGMPKLNGLEACQLIRQQPWGKAIAMIALTGWGQEEDRRRSQDAGFDYHLVKPVDINTLLQILETENAKRA